MSNRMAYILMSVLTITIWSFIMIALVDGVDRYAAYLDKKLQSIAEVVR